MKKIFITLSATATLVVAIAFSSCNNAEGVKKQVEDQNATIQTAVDEKLNALQEEVNAACTARVDSIANVAYAEFLALEAKNTKGGVKKPTVKKPVVKKVEPKDPQKDRNGGKGTVTEIQKDRNSDPKKTDVENQKKRN